MKYLFFILLLSGCVSVQQKGIMDTRNDEEYFKYHEEEFCHQGLKYKLCYWGRTVWHEAKLLPNGEQEKCQN